MNRNGKKYICSYATAFSKEYFGLNSQTRFILVGAIWPKLLQNRSSMFNVSIVCTCIYLEAIQAVLSWPCCNKLSHFQRADKSSMQLPTLVPLLQTWRLGMSECVGEVKRLDQINIQQQL